ERFKQTAGNAGLLLAESGAPLVGSVVGAAVGGLVGGPAGAAAGGGLVSFVAEYNATFFDQLAQEGVDLEDEAALTEALDNPELRADAASKAMVRATIVAAADALGMRLAIAPKLTRGIPTPSFRRRAGEAGLDATIGATTAGAGEALGSVAIGEEVKAGAVLS